MRSKDRRDCENHQVGCLGTPETVPHRIELPLVEHSSIGDLTIDQSESDAEQAFCDSKKGETQEHGIERSRDCENRQAG